MTPEAVLNVLREQVGRESALKANEIVETVTNKRTSPGLERELRGIINALCLEGWPICSSSYHGYWWAESPEEITATCKSLQHRAVSSLMRIGKLKRLALPLLSGQMVLPLDGVLPRVPEMDCSATGGRIVELPEDLDVMVARYLEGKGVGQDELFALALALYMVNARVDGAKRIYRRLAEV